MLLMAEKGISGGTCHVIHGYAKANNCYMKDSDKNKEPSYLKYWCVNKLYNWATFQKLPVNRLQQIEDTHQFNEDFPKIFNDKSNKMFFFEVDIQDTAKQHDFIMIYHFHINK